MQRGDRIFRTLANPSRRAIFERLARRKTTVKDLTARFDISQPAVSQHLAELHRAGLVRKRRDGRLVYYRVERNGLQPLVDWIARSKRCGSSTSTPHRRESGARSPRRRRSSGG